MKLTNHAQKRCRQRGIPESVADLIVEYGEPKNAVGNAIKYEVSGSTINALQAQVKTLINQIDKLKNKVVMVSNDGTIITTYHKKG